MKKVLIGFKPKMKHLGSNEILKAGTEQKVKEFFQSQKEKEKENIKFNAQYMGTDAEHLIYVSSRETIFSKYEEFLLIDAEVLEHL